MVLTFTHKTGSPPYLGLIPIVPVAYLQSKIHLHNSVKQKKEKKKKE